MKHCLSVLTLSVLCALLIICPLHAREIIRVSPLCPAGSAEVEALFQQARDRETGRKGDSLDYVLAAELYQRAVDLGSAKAAINLGILYRMKEVLVPNGSSQLDFSIRMYVKAWDMGCPDAMAHLAYAQDNGWGLPRNPRKAAAMLRLGAESGSPVCMMSYGKLLHDRGREKGDPALRAEGVAWLTRALEHGNGKAGSVLGDIYGSKYRGETPDAEKMIRFYREGAKQGSRFCLWRLSWVYKGDSGQKNGDRHDGQIVDRTYAECFHKIAEGIDGDSAPPLIDLDAHCPPRPVLPFDDKE